MKIRTLDELLRVMDEDRIWRIREITLLRSQFVDSKHSDAIKGALRRSFIPLAYAHWEGYVKKVGQSYLDYVAVQKLKLGELSPNFQSLYFSIECHSDLSQMKRHSLQGVLSRMKSSMNDRVYIRSKGVISTQGNLNSDALTDICLNLGIDVGAFKFHVSFIDKILVARRNAIAHGQADLVDDRMAEDIRQKVVECIDIYKGLAVDSATNRRYRV